MDCKTSRLTVTILLVLMISLSPQVILGIGSHSPAAEHDTSWPLQPLSLEDALARALANNATVRAGYWETQAALARKDIASSTRMPRVGITGSYMRHLDEQRLVPATSDGGPGLFARDIFTADLLVSVPLYSGGRLVNQIAANELLHESTYQRLSRSRDELIFNVTSLYLSILAQKQSLTAYEFSLSTLQQQLTLINELIAARKAAEVERMRTEVRLVDIEQTLIKERNLLVLQERTLAGLLGIRERGAGPLIAGELNSTFVETQTELPDLFARAREQRGDYRAQVFALEAQQRQIDIARAAYRPALNLQGSYGGRWAPVSTSGRGDDHADVGRIGLVLEIPLYTGGQVNASVREQQAQLQVAQSRLRGVEEQIDLEIESALLNIHAAASRGRALEMTVELARKTLQIEQQKYHLGSGTVIDVLDAQAALLQTETTYYRVLADYHTAQAQLNLAVGGQ